MSQNGSEEAAPSVAVTYDDLLDVATNLRWTWKMDARRLFAMLDPAASPGALEWPQQLLLGLGRDRVNTLITSNPDLARLAGSVVQNFRDYFVQTPSTWYQTQHRSEKDQVIAFFAAEFSLTDSLPIFAGGLGTVAAEQLKASSALGLPLVGVGLLYRGTSHQWLDREGRQHEAWDMMSPEKMPIERVRDANILYDLLEREVKPMFFSRDANGVPVMWLSRIRASLRSLAPMYSSARMVDDYVEQIYRVAAPAELSA